MVDLFGWRRRRPRKAVPRPGADGAEATAELYRNYYEPLLAFTTRLTAGDRHWAEDVVQDTLLRAWRDHDRLDDRAGSLMPWLATVARRLVVDGHRRRTARPREVGEAPLRAVAVPDPSDELLRTVLVAEALRSLSVAHREVLVETLLRDQTVSHAADVLGIPVGTAKSRIFHGMRALRQVLEGMGVRTP